jgi:hypothetical protein
MRVPPSRWYAASGRQPAEGFEIAGTVVDPVVTERMLHRSRNNDALRRLTERERDVLAVMA